jgi:DNA topoisomerase IB
MRLRRSNLEEPGIRRQRRGSGFRYLDPNGDLVGADTRQRISALAIPPAWTDVWIAPYANGHIQAVGTDDAGRRQYLYHEHWRLSRDREKHARVLRLARRLPAIREAVEQDLTAKGLGRERVLAAALRMLDYGVFRTGGEEYLEDYGTHGVATLHREHATVRSGDIEFEFPAKGGLDRSAVLSDETLAAAVTAMKRSKTDSDRLLVYRTTSGWCEVTADEVNARFKVLAGDDFTVKDLRTWQATVIAAIALAEADPPTSKTARKRVERQALEVVAEELGNTPAVARKSYVDPNVFEAFTRGRTIERALSRIGSNDRSDPAIRLRIERAVIRLLSE